MKNLCARFLFLLLSLWAFIPAARAANGTWTNLAGGSWTNPGNWSGGVIANGSGFAANFGTLSLTSDATVTLDSPRTISGLTFGDQSVTKHNWFLLTGSAGPLTFAGTPSVTVNSGVATIGAAVAGTVGLTKAGSGKLVLGGGNSYSGTTTVNAGALGLFGASFSASSPLNITAAGATVDSDGTLNLLVNSSGVAADITGSGSVRLVSTTNSASAPDLYFGPNHNANNYWGARLASPLNLGSSQRYVYGRTGHNGVGRYGLSSADCQFAGTISGSGGLTIIAQNNWSDMEVGFALNANNTFTGPLEIQRGSVYLGNANALNKANPLRFNAAAGNNARFFLYGNNAAASDLSSPGAGTSVIANGNLKTGASLTLGAVTLSITQNNNGVYGGLITDAFSEYDGSGSGTTGPLSLLKIGPATLTLDGANDYSGTTTVAGGRLEINGSTAAGAVTVQNGGALGGRGTINGPVTIQNGGTLAPGAAGIGSMVINQSLSLAGTTVMKVSKSGALTSDQVAGVSTVAYGGSLVLTNVGAGAPQAGDTTTLFSAYAYNGGFTNFTFPTLSGGMLWDASNLVVNGSITVVLPNAAPVFTTHPAGATLTEGSPAQLTAVAAGPRPLGYHWQKNGANIPGATSNSFSISATTTNDTAGYRVIATNGFGSSTSYVANLTVLPAGIPTPITNSLVVYLNFDNNMSAQGGTTNNGALYTGGAQNGPRYKAGVISRAATFANDQSSGQPNDWAITLGNLERFYSNSFTVSFWERTLSSGDGALIGNKNWVSGANVGWVISSLDVKNLNYNAVGGTRRDIDLNPPFSDGGWHLVTVTFDRAANQAISYMDGLPANTSDISPSGTASFNAGYATLVGSSGNGSYAATADIDDLGIWARALAPDEVMGIFGAGMNQRPLLLAVPGQAPVISAQPASANVAAGGAAHFTVSVSGPGTFTYQWRFNGANIAGATNATLVLSDASAANQGVYTVLVSNGSGAVVSAGAVLTVYELAVTGQWDFRQGDLRATAGSDLEFVGDTAAITSFGSRMIDGQAVPVMGFGANSAAQGFYMRHGAKPNGSGELVNQYTLLMDVMYPAASSGTWRALLQADPFNHSGNDAEFFIGDASAQPDPNGLGTESQFNGSLAPDTWYRIAFAVDLLAPAGQQLSKFVNGVKVGSQSLAGGVDGRYALGPSALLFTRNGGTTAAGFVSSIQFVNGCLSAQAIAALGGPTADKLPPGNGVIQFTGIAKWPSVVDLSWTGPMGVFQLQGTTSLVNSTWQTVTNVISNRTATVSAPDPMSWYRVGRYFPDIQVGQMPFGEQSVPTKQILRAAGDQVQFGGRPVDLVLSPDGSYAYIKNMNNLLVMDTSSWTILQTLNYPAAGASMHGITVRGDGARVYVTGANNELYEWSVAANGFVSYSRTIAMPGDSYPCGVALSANGASAYVCLSIHNKLAVVNLGTGAVTQQINVGIAPWDVVLSPDGLTAYVSDWGGRIPVAGDLTAPSAGTQVVIDNRGVGASGAASIVNLGTGLEITKVATGLHPSALALSADGGTLYVANANSDTVTVIDTVARTAKETILVRPDATFPYGSQSDGLALSADGKNLFVASGGNNAVAMVELPNAQHTNSVLLGFLPTDWYPGAVAADSNYVYVVNVKGLGTRQGQPAPYYQIGQHLGTANRMRIPDLDTLSKFTAAVYEQGRIPEIRKTQALPQPGIPPVPVPLRVGEPSVFQHVVYIIKENKTYDQVFGDMPEGNGMQSLCIYPQFVTPNHHSLARQFVLLDNFYCAGVNSADGHSWATEANNTDHLEKSFGGFSRRYTFGDDPLTYSSSGFVWNNVLEHGLTFRNYGEMDYASPSPANATWNQIYTDFTNGTKSIRYVQNIGIASLRPYSSTNVPGWNMGIPDVVRADGFIRELQAAQARGSWETFHLLYLPDDHTGGPPSARAQVADNDLSLGRVVEAISQSIFWSNTVIFVIEDDPQSGYDHVDAHRSICLVVSPYTKRGVVVSTFYNQPGVIHTMEQIMGLAPMNQQDAMAPLMFECFTNVANLTPYTALPSNIDLAEGTTGAAQLSPKARYWAKKVQKMDFSKPDRIDDNAFNRYIWHSIKGDEPYPSKYVGAHGKGLKKLGLVLAKGQKDEDD